MAKASSIRVRWFNDRGADCKFAIDQGAGGDGDAGFLDVRQYVGVQGIDDGSIGPDPETDDVEADRGEQFEPRIGFDRGSEGGGDLAGLFGDAAQSLGAVAAERGPDFERAEAAGQIGAEIARPQIAGGEAAFFAAEVIGGVIEGGEVLFGSRTRAMPAS